MYTWVYTGEANAKRLRERYLQAVLRQDIAYFDNVGAGEVATRIQTDTRAFFFLICPINTGHLLLARSCSTGNLGKGCACGQLPGGVRYGFRPRIRQVMAPGPCIVVYSAVHWYHRCRDESLHLHVYAVRIYSDSTLFPILIDFPGCH